MMPGLNGIQLCRMFRADPALKNTPVIFLTAKAGEHDRVQGLETGADDTGGSGNNSGGGGGGAPSLFYLAAALALMGARLGSFGKTAKARAKWHG